MSALLTLMLLRGQVLNIVCGCWEILTTWRGVFVLELPWITFKSQYLCRCLHHTDNITCLQRYLQTFHQFLWHQHYIFNDTCRHFQPYLWCQNWLFLQCIGCIAIHFAGSNPVIFHGKSGGPKVFETKSIMFIQNVKLQHKEAFSLKLSVVLQKHTELTFNLEIGFCL